MCLCGSADPFPAAGAPWEAFRVVHPGETFHTASADAVRVGVRISSLRHRGFKGQGSPTLQSSLPDLSWAPRGEFSVALETRVSAGRGGTSLLSPVLGNQRQENGRELEF